MKDGDGDIFNFRYAKQAVLEFTAVAIVIAVIVLIAYCQVRSMLNSALEESVERTVQTIAYELEKQFDLELTSLKTRAGFIEENKIQPKELVLALEDMDGKNIGIISVQGELLAGRKPPEEIIKIILSDYGNKSTIRYLHGIGVVFAVPIQIDDKWCILFDYYSDEAVRNKFRTISFNGDGTVILLNRLENWIVLAEGNSPIKEFTELGEGFWILGEKIGYNQETDSVDKNSGAIYYDFNGDEYFIYSAVVSKENHFAVSGYVPWKSVAVGFDSIYIIMLVAFGLLILLLIMIARALFKTRERKQLEQEKMLALQASQTKSDFLSSMSHEIRTPINAIIGMNEIVIRESKDKNVLECSKNLQNAAKTLLGLVNDILDFSKIEAGKMEIINAEYSLSSLLNDLVNMIKPRADKKKLQVMINIDRNLPSILYGDEIRIKQVVTNLLTNAVKYTEKGSVTLNVSFENFAENVILLKISVVDTGIGIKDEDIEKLFSAFERIEEKRNRSIEGTGLGMNITQRLLAMMNSKLEVSSIYGKGSTFAFKITQKIINDEPLGDFNEVFKTSLSKHKEYHEKFTAPDAKILVVDDTPMNLTVVNGLLKQTQIKIDTADSGYEALSMVNKNHYDIIFLDHRMPGLDGIETLHKMKTLENNKNFDTPVISLTANAISGAREEYIAEGFIDYLTKPINSSELEDLIIKYLPSELVKISENNSEEIIENKMNLPKWLETVEGLDTSAGIEHCGSVEEYINALTIFAEAINSGANEIQNYFNNEDWKNYTTKVHALKSSAKVIGAIELSKLAEKLEDAGNSGYTGEIQEDTPTLLKLYKSYAEKLSPLLKNDSDNSSKPFISNDELAEAYETIKEISVSFDYDSLQFVLKSLENYNLPENEQEKFKNLKSAMNNLDWEKIKRLLNEE